MTACEGMSHRLLHLQVAYNESLGSDGSKADSSKRCLVWKHTSVKISEPWDFRKEDRTCSMDCQ